MVKVKVRGLVHSAGWIFFLWGCVAAIKGFRDAFFGEPEANFYSPAPWEFVTREQWFTWAGFETAYGMACVGLAYVLWRYARRLPEFIER